MAYPDWRALPFQEIWVCDTEYYPGSGLANGGRGGDAQTPLCVVAHEMRSGRTIRLWQDELGPFPPYRLDDSALFVAFVAAAEFGTHTALGWGEPARAIDAYLEFRHYTNDGSVKAGDREKGFYGLAGALSYFCEDSLDVTHKKDMRDRILDGPPFSAQERQDILEYCESDVLALARLLPHIVPTIRSFPHAMLRAKYQWAAAKQEARGVPIDLPMLSRIRSLWPAMQCDLVAELDRPFGIYEIVDGVPHWRRERFENFVLKNEMSWPRHDGGDLDETDQTFREMEGKYPAIGPLRELRYSSVQVAAERLTGRQRRAESNTTVGVWDQNRPEHPVEFQVRVRSSEMDQIADHASARARADSPRLLSARGPDRGRAIWRHRASRRVRERRRLHRRRAPSRIYQREYVG